MAAPTKANIFVPKQCPPRTPLILDAIQGDVTKQVARYALTLAPPITPESIVHDNACGTGAVTEIIAQGTHPVKLNATDLLPPFAQVVAGKAQEHGWTWVQAEAMNALELAFPDNTFTHSITNFCIQVIPDPKMAVSHIHRTVKPGHTAIVTSWAPVPHAAAVESANARVRGPDVVLPVRFTPETHTSTWLETLLKDAGFTSVNMTQFPGYCDTKDLRAWCTSLWGFMGAPLGGWKEEDEGTWDEAVEEMVKHLGSNPDVETRADGSAVVKMVAHVAIATK